MYWLIQDEAGRELQRAREAGFRPTETQRAEFMASYFDSAAGGGSAQPRPLTASLAGVPRNLRVAGDVAEIRVEGVLTEKPDFFAYFFGGGNTTYEQIRQALSLCQSDAQIKRVEFFVSSPGGLVEGLFDTLAAIEAFKKPKSVRASKACSAAFAIAALAGKIEATNVAAEFGSVGVCRTYYVDEHLVDITSTEAPNKRPDPTTPEGQAVIREELDAIHEVFADAIARGRDTTVRDVNQNFGRGSTLLAADAKRRGMIDKVARPQLRAVAADDAATAEDQKPTAAVGDLVAAQLPATAPSTGAQPTETIMNKKELQEKYPEIYSAIAAEGRAEGVAQGEKTERDRVVAHLTMGEASGDTKTAFEAIKSGEGMTATINAKYMAAAMNRRDTNARQADSDAAGAAVAGATPPAADKDLGDQVVATLEQQHGKQKKTA